MSKAKVSSWDLIVDERTGDKQIKFELLLKEKVKVVRFTLDGMGIRLFLKWCGVRNWKSARAFYPDKLLGKLVKLPTKPLIVRR